MKKTFIKVVCLAMLVGILNPQAVLAKETENKSPLTYTGDPEKAITDTNKPVIEGIEFPENGKEIKVGDNVPIYVKAYDADSGIERVDVWISYRTEGDQHDDSDQIELKYNAETKRYEGNFVVKNKVNMKANISRVKAVDNASNYAEGVVRDEFSKPLYTFKVIGGVPGDKIEMDINSIEFAQNTKSVDYGDEINLGITLPNEISESYKNITNVRMYFKNGNYTDDFYMYKTQDNSNKFTGNSTLSHYSSSGKYVLDHLEFTSEGNITNTVTFKNSESMWFVLNEKKDKIDPVITSIEMDRKGEFLKTGDVVTIRIKATDDIALSYSDVVGANNDAYLYFRPIMDIDANSLQVSLDYDGTKGEFVGKLSIPEEIYPCEWNISQIDIRDTSGNYAEYYDFLNSSNPYYFNIKNDSAFVNPTYDLQVSANVLNKDGDYVSVGEWKKDNVERRTTLKENGYVFPDGSTSYGGLVFKGWADYRGNPIDENTEITGNNFSSIYAVYDKMVIQSRYTYPKSDLTTSYMHDKITVASGTTYHEAMEMAKNKQVDSLYQGEEFEKWEVSFSPNSQDINVNSEIKFSPYLSVQLDAIYKNKKIVNISSSYINIKADFFWDERMVFVDNGTTYETVLANLDSKAPESYEGLRFKEWGQSSETGEITENYTNIYQNAVYENYIVRFLLRSRSSIDSKGVMPTGVSGGGTIDDIFAEVAEKGDTLKIPEFTGYSNVEWLHMTPNENTVVESNLSFYGIGDKAGDPVKPEKPVEPEKPINPDNSGAIGSSKLPEEKIHQALNDIKHANTGDVISLDMGSATTISKEILEVARGKDVIVKLVMNGYSWSINGMDIAASNLEDINLEVKFNTSNIPSKTVQALAGDNPVKQLSLSHNGDFGFKAQLSFDIGAEHNGKYGNLFYHDSEGKMVFMNAGKINETGEVAVSFSHASEYAIVVNENIMQNKHEDVVKATGNNNANGNLVCLLLLFGVFLIGTNNNKKIRKIK